MRIVEDNVTVHPPHFLTKAEVKMIRDHLPEEWVRDVDLVCRATRRSGSTTLRPYAVI